MKEWELFLSSLEKEFGKKSIDQWLRQLKVLNFDARNIYLKASDSFQISWFNEHIKPKLDIFTNSNNRKIKVHFELSSHKKIPQKDENNPSEAFSFDKIEPFYHLSNFFFSEKNEIIRKLFSQLSGFNFSSCKVEKPMLLHSTFNPIFIYGVKESGKTHLLTAIAKQFLDLSLKVIYVNAETFTKHVVSSIRGGYMPLFRKRYRLADVLILDDIHLFSNRAATQEEFFHTFNALHTAGKQIILSANLPPYSLTGIEPRLTSRFEWGITCLLEKLSKKDMEFALAKRENFLNIYLLNAQKQFLIQNFNSPKNLFSAFDTFSLRASDKIDKINTAEMKIILSDILSDMQKNSLTSKGLINLVTKHFGIQEVDLLNKSQSKEFSFPRQIAIYLMRSDLHLTFKEIAKIFDRDHSTIISSVKKIEDLKESKAKDILEKIRNGY
jgi:chromosomal replication initiator protein